MTCGDFKDSRTGLGTIEHTGVDCLVPVTKRRSSLQPYPKEQECFTGEYKKIKATGKDYTRTGKTKQNGENLGNIELSAKITCTDQREPKCNSTPPISFSKVDAFWECFARELLTQVPSGYPDGFRPCKQGFQGNAAYCWGQKVDKDPGCDGYSIPNYDP